MIRNLPTLIFTLSLLFSLNLSAQDILLEELFDDSTLGSFTAYSVEGDDQVWQPRDFDNKFFAQMNGFDGEIIDNEDWLISPALNMDQYSDEILTFETASNFNGPDLELLVSTDYDGTSDPNTATWTDLSDQVTWSQGDFEYVPSGEVDLSSFSGTGYVAFKYISTFVLDGKLWQVDSVVVRANSFTNTEEPENPSLISAPVTVDGQLQFNVLQSNLDLNFEIYTIGGVAVETYQKDNSNDLVSISISDYPSGMYVLVVRSDEQMKSYKFIR